MVVAGLGSMENDNVVEAPIERTDFFVQFSLCLNTF